MDQAPIYGTWLARSRGEAFRSVGNRRSIVLPVGRRWLGSITATCGGRGKFALLDRLADVSEDLRGSADILIVLQLDDRKHDIFRHFLLNGLPMLREAVHRQCPHGRNVVIVEQEVAIVNVQARCGRGR